MIITSFLVHILEGELAEALLSNYVASWRQGGCCHARAWDLEDGTYQVAEKHALENPSQEVVGREAARQEMLLSQAPMPSEYAPLPHWNSLLKSKFKYNINDFKTMTTRPFWAHSPVWLQWLYIHEVNPGQCAAQEKYEREQHCIFLIVRFIPRIKWFSGKWETRGYSRIRQS